MAIRLIALALLPATAFAGIFGPPQFVQDACKGWCDGDQSNPDVKEACDACGSGPQSNPACKESQCTWCEENIVFERHYPKLWLEEPKFDSVTKIEGKTRCWCDTGCPVYYAKSWMFCHSECSTQCEGQ